MTVREVPDQCPEVGLHLGCEREIVDPHARLVVDDRVGDLGDPGEGRWILEHPWCRAGGVEQHLDGGRRRRGPFDLDGDLHPVEPIRLVVIGDGGLGQLPVGNHDEVAVAILDAGAAPVDVDDAPLDVL